MIKYRLMDLNDNEFFADEWEARERLKSWLYMAQDNARSALASAQPEEIRRWKRDEDFYRSSGALECEIRLYKIDTDIYDTVSTTVEALGLEWPAIDEDE